MIYLIVSLMLLADVLWCVLSYRALRKVGMRFSALFALFFGLLQLAAILRMVLLPRLGIIEGSFVNRWEASAVIVWHLIFMLPWLIWQFAKGLVLLGKRLSRVESLEIAPGTPAYTRRQFITTAAVFTPPMLTGLSSVVGERQLEAFRIRRMDVPLANLPPALDGLTIAQVTDMHVGNLTRGPVLEKIVEATNKLEADIVALTGDYINDSLRAMPAAMSVVQALRAKHTVVACEGNHDLIDNASRFYALAEKAGMPLLRNETSSVTIRGQRVQFLGLPWSRKVKEGAAAVRELLQKRDPNAWQIMLAHHPHAWDHAEGVPLTLAGHTHGGQLMLTEEVGGGPLIYRYWSGLYTRQQQNDEALIVSNGVGNWFPVRIQAPAEILHITLRRKA